MQPFATDSPQALARVLVLALIADTELSERELHALDELDAFDRIGLPRAQFAHIAREYCAELLLRMGRHGALRLNSPELFDEVLAGVENRGLRLLVCRLVAGVISADGAMRGAERQLYLHILKRWGLSERLVLEAIRAERQPFAEALAEP
jgi:hypothetical protein